ncbi:PREDICTED: beta-mannosidase-like [Acropora digitifera]|uniref:beta-mannosidase-like n=1 Tax=Acropora digitifera TaxID=70779 RepID=UPI00077A5EEA|nr:PREDICTED: beta-mannosidase-like [Acropora digitifera]
MAVWRNFEQMKYILVFLCCCRHIDRISSTEINLGGPWKVQNANKSLSVYGEVPGNVHTALFRNGRIPNPYFRFNDVQYRWIAYDNWTYSRTLEVSEALHSKRQVVLVFEGLDTVATVLVNGIKVGQSANMFHRYIFDAKGALKTGLNMIEVRFMSAILYAKEQAKKYPYPVPPECPVPVQRGECHGNFIRKEQSSFSWDWGPAFVPQGIWLMHINTMYNFVQMKTDNIVPHSCFRSEVTSENVTWELSVEAFVHAANDLVPGSLSISLPELSRSLKFALKLSKGMHRVSFPVMTFSKKDGVKEWWPHGYGKQNLYALKVVFTSSSGEEMSSISRKIGFRKVRLVQEQIKQSTGLGFHFEINDLPIFLKGANWIPADAFEDRVTSSVLRNLLQSAADANMNVIRNWGGGIYQHDEFYSIADELGYKIYDGFTFWRHLRSSFWQVRRLHYHPSVFLWSANNENEVALADNWYNTTSTFSRYAKDYVKVSRGMLNAFEDTMTIILNSIWQAPTWSSLEYGGRWKMLHYFAKDFYAPVIASPFVHGTKFQIFVISDLTKPIVKGAVSLKAWAWSSFKPLSSKSITFNINQTTSKLVYSEDLETLIKNSGCESLYHCVLTVTPADLSTGENLGPSNVFYPADLSEVVGLNEPQLKVLKVTQKTKVEFTVSIGAQSPAVFVWLVSKDFNGRFSENGFLLTESFKTVTFYSWQETTAADLEKSLYIKSLYDLYTS